MHLLRKDLRGLQAVFLPAAYLNHRHMGAIGTSQLYRLAAGGQSEHLVAQLGAEILGRIRLIIGHQNPLWL